MNDRIVANTNDTHHLRTLDIHQSQGGHYTVDKAFDLVVASWWWKMPVGDCLVEGSIDGNVQ